MRTAFIALVLLTAFTSAACAKDIVIGSKKFTESVVLGEIARDLIEAQGMAARHRRELGGTRILWEALLRGDIDLYPEYTGTIAQELLSGATLPDQAAIAVALAERGLAMSEPLGFNDTYALALRPDTARTQGLTKISDLAGRTDLRFGFSNEFIDRADGWPGLKRAYGLDPKFVRGLDHDLAYRGLDSGAIDVTDAYTTDAEIPYYGLRLLADDHHYFPDYQAVFLYRLDLEAKAVTALNALAGAIDETAMQRMNQAVKLGGKSDDAVAARFVADTFGVDSSVSEAGLFRRIWRTTLAHLTLVGISLGAAIVIAIPLGIWAHLQPRVGQAVLSVVGLLQTVPSLALFVFMIPLLGIGGPPAIMALFLYSLLPIVRTTHAGLQAISGGIRESAMALGLPLGARLRLVEIPMAVPAILAGIKTSAVINVGTATLGALIGAGGYGQPILTGIRLDNMGLILEGAIPAAVLALLIQGLFELFERVAVPRGLRL
jgi:osmoprotectant transport system substrate-binding protein/osmoprotectant transport system permease protein